MPAPFLFGSTMLHNEANIAKLSDRLVVILRERALSVERPDEFGNIAAPLIRDTRPRAAEKFAIKTPSEIKGPFSDTMATLVAAKVSKPAVIKSVADKAIQEGCDAGVLNALERHRVAQHKAKMRKDGHSRATATPGVSAGSGEGAFS
jgi:hypothetical protein